MRQAVRRMVGVGGATTLAIGAALVLALPASAHDFAAGASCQGDNAVLNVKLTNYVGNKNTVTITDTPDGGTTTTPFDQKFGPNFEQTIVDQDATVGHTFHVVVQADDKKSSDRKKYSHDETYTTPACMTPPTTTTTPPTTTTTTTTTAPPTTTTTTAVVPTSSGTTAPPAPETTTAAVVAATTTTPGSGSLPFTGVNTALPLGIAGLLVIAGGGILFWLRFNARRRHSS